ncbi:hypothetical protein VCUG_01115 [Vavraia culicis subsp. floridensis]|uniref:Splicing factor YJU2 n=1 Tax=Vavraia culicis (isolate floridensis) TaxID=948595 RepID=L2GUK3_VAVCU|nr:uncharacterized protein VCUG_01115 [Vavraia culicis subsp. floridensis]ELA47346.1 hypothetical protein VCUG_01115 [Vavraia culicis subsp. floridensis]
MFVKYSNFVGAKSEPWLNYHIALATQMPRKRKSFIEKYYKFALKNNPKTNCVRISLPLTIKCTFCSTFAFKGSKHNALKKKSGTQMGADSFLFFIRCHKCNNEMMIQTNPLQGSYTEYGGCRSLNEENRSEKDVEKSYNTPSASSVIEKLKTSKRLEDVEEEIMAQLRR